jgi:murein DD-endopeptidase MepM/ murein hydrolase activator NlpD
MKIRFPYPGIEHLDWFITQGYDSNPINGLTGQPFYNKHHGGLDVIPITGKYGNSWNAPIYPILDGTTLSVSTTDISRGLGIKVRTVLDIPLKAYFKNLGLIPVGYEGEVWLDHLYWHMYKVTDLDSQVDEKTPVGLTGNSGNVFSGGLPVPDSEKNKPPNWPGLHLHFEYYLRSPDKVFNLDRDEIGRLRPEYLWGYKEIPMPQFKTQIYKGEKRVVLQVSTPQQWTELCKVFGLNPDALDENIN